MYLRRSGFLYAITISRCLAFPENFCARSVNEDQDALVSLIGDSPLHESHRLLLQPIEGRGWTKRQDAHSAKEKEERRKKMQDTRITTIEL